MSTDLALRFSDHFELSKSQAELDFVDIPLNTDIPLFLDPFAISIEKDEWFRECNYLICHYFQLLIDTIRRNDQKRAMHLLSNLHEPNDTHFGFSGGKPSGRGIGYDQAYDLYERLKKSRAVQTGTLKDISDCELVIPGIGSDKISDMTINITREKLIEYTQTQCLLLNIPMRKVPSKPFWTPEKEDWSSGYKELPVYENQAIVLVPKSAVRLRMTFDHQEYYNFDVLEFLQAEYIEAGSGLVKTLKNGTEYVTKKSLKEIHPCSKNLLYEFSEKHPEILEKYKGKMFKKAQFVLEDEDIEEVHPVAKEVNPEKLVTELSAIQPGNATASQYHNFIIGALEFIFYPYLRTPVKEQEIHDGRKRIDIVFTKTSQEGFFNDLTKLHSIHCPYVFFECKNYNKEIENPELDQICGRFSPTRGQFGIVVCRDTDNKILILNRCKDIVKDQRGTVIVLFDEDIIKLIQFKSNRNLEAINNYMSELLKNIIL